MTRHPSVQLNHVAVLTASIEACLASLPSHGDPVGPVDTFPGEGTRECYVGRPGSAGRLLLMQAIGPGPYRQALERRGTGLHHIALDVPDVEAFLDRIASAGWFLHCHSLAMWNRGRTVFLARPGVPALIEVHEQAEPLASPGFVTGLAVPGCSAKPRLWDSLDCPGLAVASGPAIQVVTAAGPWLPNS